MLNQVFQHPLYIKDKKQNAPLKASTKFNSGKTTPTQAYWKMKPNLSHSTIWLCTPVFYLRTLVKSCSHTQRGT